MTACTPVQIAVAVIRKPVVLAARKTVATAAKPVGHGLVRAGWRRHHAAPSASKPAVRAGACGKVAGALPAGPGGLMLAQVLKPAVGAVAAAGAAGAAALLRPDGDADTELAGSLPVGDMVSASAGGGASAGFASPWPFTSSYGVLGGATPVTFRQPVQQIESVPSGPIFLDLFEAAWQPAPEQSTPGAPPDATVQVADVVAVRQVPLGEEATTLVATPEPSPSPVPEPSAVLIFAAAAAGVLLLRLIRRHA